jgi:CRP-like cAMP-binding protein
VEILSSEPIENHLLAALPHPESQRWLLRYTQALITQMSQTAVCNRHHSLDQQLCRWLLLSLDRLEGNQLVMTQELIANMLGVRREGVTEGALKLQQAGLVQYARGHITVLDRAGLEKRSCECYAVVKEENRVLARSSHVIDTM